MKSLPLKKTILASLFIGILLLNVLAWNHVRAMTVFVNSGTHTAKPEHLSIFEKLSVILSGVRVQRPSNNITPADMGHTFKVAHIKSLDGLNDLEAWVLEAKESSTIVLFFHGYSSSKESQLNEASILYQSGYSVVLIDFFGSGGSTGSSTGLGYLEASDVIASVRYVEKTFPNKRVVLYGASMGGSALLKAVSEDKIKVDGIILEAVFDKLESTVGRRFQLMGLPESPGKELLMLWGGVQLGFNPFSHNPVDYAAAISTPALMLHGGKDKRVTIGQAKSLYNAFPGPRRLVIFENASHEAMIGVNPDKWLESVLGFLSDITKTKEI